MSRDNAGDRSVGPVRRTIDATRGPVESNSLPGSRPGADTGMPRTRRVGRNVQLVHNVDQSRVQQLLVDADEDGGETGDGEPPRDQAASIRGSRVRLTCE